MPPMTNTARLAGTIAQLSARLNLELPPDACTRILARPAGDVLWRVRFTSADAVVIQRMRPHVVRREQPSFLKSPPGVHLKRVKGAVAVVPAPGNDTELRVRLRAGGRVDCVDVGARPK